MLTAQDLMMPKGPVDPVLFPETQVPIIESYLAQYLANGYNDARVAAQTDVALKDTLAWNWALYQVFQGAANRMSAEPLTVNRGGDGGSTGYSAAQIANIQAQADKYLAAFLGLLTEPAAVPQAFPGTQGIATEVSW